ncbi:MAG: phosphoenolpyruvate--protein phosphotransferase [Acidobacteria bacterium]|nr:phosphoenolpyruvate--protein phosphotransferase [Acidobacteriota bacterium]
MTRLQGLGVSRGTVTGVALVLQQPSDIVHYAIDESRVDHERQVLQRACDDARAQLHVLRHRLAKGPARDLATLFDAQRLMLDDPLLTGRAHGIISEAYCNAAWALHLATQEVLALFTDVDDAYLRERRLDMADVAARVQMVLRHDAGGLRDALAAVTEPTILVTDGLSASLAAQIDWTRIRGCVVEEGSPTYHTAILARALHVPAVVGLVEATRLIASGTRITVDGDAGTVLVSALDEPPAIHPTALAASDAMVSSAREASPSTRRRATTRDQIEVVLEANIERVDDAARASASGADGVGLFRSEFLLAGRHLDDVSEDEQVEAYSRLLATVAPGRVTIRTFDLDESHMSTSGRGIHGSGRGLRGLRLGLAHPLVLRRQLRALARSASSGHLRVMFPFVTTVDEIREARRHLAEVCAEVGVPRMPSGALIEVPAAAVASDLMAAECDFLTIGTNDLIQYTMAVDRIDARVSDRYQPLHPALLRLLRLVTRAGRRRSIPVSICGEMAGDAALLALLVGLGLREFSMAPSAMPVAREAIASLHAGAARQMACEALALATATEISDYLEDALRASLMQPGRA